MQHILDIAAESNVYPTIVAPDTALEILNLKINQAIARKDERDKIITREFLEKEHVIKSNLEIHAKNLRIIRDSIMILNSNEKLISEKLLYNKDSLKFDTIQDLIQFHEMFPKILNVIADSETTLSSIDRASKMTAKDFKDLDDSVQMADVLYQSLKSSNFK